MLACGQVRIRQATLDRGRQVRAHGGAVEAREVDREERADRELRRPAEVRGAKDHDGLRDVVGPVARARALAQSMTSAPLRWSMTFFG